MVASRRRTEILDFHINAVEMEVFRCLSADTNPLHSDEDFARRHGFKGVVVYGALIVAQVSCLLGTRMPGFGCVWRSFTLDFRNPLYVGEQARMTATIVHANEVLGLFDLAVAVDAEGRRIAEGKAAAMLRQEDAYA